MAKDRDQCQQPDREIGPRTRFERRREITRIALASQVGVGLHIIHVRRIIVEPVERRIEIAIDSHSNPRAGRDTRIREWSFARGKSPERIVRKQ